MNDYIRREDALNMDFRISVRSFESRLKTAERAVQAYADAIADLPSADVVEVVRCEDCKHWTKFPNLQQAGQCHHFDLFVEDTFYCADGERRSE